jgi:hypothetical protein
MPTDLMAMTQIMEAATTTHPSSQQFLDPGILAMVLHHVREAMYDIRPTSERLKPFMYWNSAKSTACAKMLIKRKCSLASDRGKYRRNEFARMVAHAVLLN